MPLWRWVIVENYSEESSVALFVFHHSITDGINIAAFLRLVSDDGNDNTTIRNIKGVQSMPLLT